jgi:hypothetical protein
MKTLIVVSFLFFVAAGCVQQKEAPKEEKRADNVVTRYTASLQDDVTRAKEAAAKANAAIAAQNARMRESDEQMK